MSSREFSGERIIVWPHNIDCNVSKNFGRKISLKECVSKPKLEEIIKAADNLGLSPVLENKSYPKRWYSEKGRVAVLKKTGKITTLKLIAEEIKKLRSKSGG